MMIIMLVIVDGFIGDDDFDCVDGDGIDDDYYVHKSWPSLQRPN